MSTTSADEWRRRSQVAVQSGNVDEARRCIAAGVSEHPADAGWRNSAGNLYLKIGDVHEAIVNFSAARDIRPTNLEYPINLAIALTAAGRPTEALEALRPVEADARSSAQYCSTRATAERAASNKAAAAYWYDAALAIEPQRPKALHGRARVALERGDPSAEARFNQALAVNPGDADLWLGRAQALDVKGEVAAARTIAEQLADQAPAWTEGLKFLAQLRLAAGEQDFTSHYRTAANRVPQDPNIPMGWIATLAGLDFHSQAAEVAADAARRFPAISNFPLLEAAYSGAAGADDIAEAIFAKLELDTPERWLHEARHRIRLGQTEQADALLEKVLSHNSDDIGGWALRGILWRITGDTRTNWLYGEEMLAQLRPLHDADTVLPPAIALLHELHENSPLPLGQSLRGGTQTRGSLFDRGEPEFAVLRDAILSTVEEYRKSLPEFEEEHPILRHRDDPWHMAGSWSVRLAGGGDHHAAHIHPQGLISSALYCELPDDRGDDPQAGWLELGRPPADLRSDLPPLATIEPKEAFLALFPSILYHGTRPFAGDRRMTVAFDIGLALEGSA